MSRSRPTNFNFARCAEKCCTGKFVSAAIDVSRHSTLSAIGFRRWPAHSAQVSVASSASSRHTDSSPLCSASNCGNCSPVPKQLLHQPCFELKENSRGSSSGNPVPQFGHARLVEKTAASDRSPDPVCTCTTPRPCCKATSSV